MRQEITRAHKGWALDTVILDNDVTRMMKEDVHGPPGEGKLFYLYLIIILYPQDRILYPTLTLMIDSNYMKTISDMGNLV